MEVTLFDRDKNTNLRQSNFLIEAKYKLTIQEFRIITVIMSMVSQYDDDFKKYQIKLADIKNLLSSKSESIVADLKKATKGLLSKPLVITHDNNIIQLNWISSAKFQKGKAFVEISLDPELKPYLLQIKSYYTEFELQELLSLRSFYSSRVYSLMKQFGTIPKRKFTVEELKEILHCKYEEKGEIVDNYSNYGNFKRRVIAPAMAEISDKTSICLTLAENKIGKKVNDVTFTITQKAANWREEVKLPEITEGKEEKPADLPELPEPKILEVRESLLKNVRVEEPKKRSHFVKPTYQELFDILLELDSGVDPQDLIDHYGPDWKKSNGKPIIDLKRTCEKWIKRGVEKGWKGKDFLGTKKPLAEVPKIIPLAASEESSEIKEIRSQIRSLIHHKIDQEESITAWSRYFCYAPIKKSETGFAIEVSDPAALKYQDIFTKYLKLTIQHVAKS